jgi:hypothetical protein
MKNACEIMIEVAVKNEIEEEKKQLEQFAKITKAMEKFQKHIEEIDAYVEKELIAGNGKAELMIDRYWGDCEGFWYFARKSYRYSSSKPYWSNHRETESFPLDFYINYLREHGYTVERVERPFFAYSSTLKSSTRMEGITLKISV